MKMLLRGLLLWLLVGASPALETDLNKAFEEGLKLSADGKMKEAREKFLSIYKQSPYNPSVIWNLGLANAALGDHAEAKRFWLEMRKVDPDDWPARAKLIQAYQALGELKERDRERDELIKAWKEAPAESEFRKATRYCREQTVLGGRKVFVFELFEPTGERKVFIRFIVLKENSEEDFHFSLGSYDTTTKVAWETGSLPRDQRLFHLDRYGRDGSHATFGFYEGQPSYEDVRAAVERALSGKDEAVSSTRPGK